jgi:hypothetical protein
MMVMNGGGKPSQFSFLSRVSDQGRPRGGAASAVGAISDK